VALHGSCGKRLTLPPEPSATPPCRLLVGTLHLAQEDLRSRREARFRAYERLQDYLRHRADDLFVTDHVRAAIQAIYDHPLTTEAWTS
jgi:hypothetical protein